MFRLLPHPLLPESRAPRQVALGAFAFSVVTIVAALAEAASRLLN